MNNEKVTKLIEQYTKLKSIKATWLPTWQTIGRFVRTTKQDFTSSITPGQFLTGRIFDGTAPASAHLMASSLLGQLYPGGDRTFKIEATDMMADADRESSDMMNYFNKCTARVRRALDHPKAGLMLALQEYFEDQVTLGTSGIFVADNPDDDDQPVKFSMIDVKAATISDNKDGLVDVVFIERHVTVRQLVEEFYYENVSQVVKNLWDQDMLEEKVTVLWAIAPRAMTKNRFGAAGFPIASIHIELEQQSVLKESGYMDMPCLMTRFWKIANEVYGRSPAFEGMPDIVEINLKREFTIIAEAKMLNPPLAFFSDGSLGGGVLRLGAGAVNVFNNSRMGNTEPFKQLITVGDIKPTMARITELIEIIKSHFFLDRLLDLNNSSRMTLGEADIRNKLRGESLVSVYSRQISELFNRLIERVWNIMFNRGLLGYPADSFMARRAAAMGEEPFIIPAALYKLIQGNKDAYKIHFVSPAMQIIRQAEMTGIQQTITFAIQAAQLQPEVLDNIDFDKALRIVREISGAPATIIRPLDQVDQLRQQKTQAQQQQQLQLQQHLQAQTAEKLGKAAQAGSKAGIPLDQLLAG